jgi:hypothetical protein
MMKMRNAYNILEENLMTTSHTTRLWFGFSKLVVAYGGEEFLHQLSEHELLKKYVLCSSAWLGTIPAVQVQIALAELWEKKSTMQAVYKSTDICDMYACAVSALAAVDDVIMTNTRLQMLSE